MGGGRHGTRQKVRTTGRYFRRCQSEKFGYGTKAEALDAAERAMLLDKVLPGCHLTPYFCLSCREWHVANRKIVFKPGKESS